MNEDNTSIKHESAITEGLKNILLQDKAQDSHQNGTLSELFTRAEETRKEGQFKQAAELFTHLWNAEKSESNGWRLLSCLRNIQSRDIAWQILYEASELIPDSFLIRSQHSWMLYDFELADAKAKKAFSKIIEVADKIFDLSTDGILLNLTVFAAIDAAKALNQPEKILLYLAMLDASKLDKRPREFRGNKIISWCERWYFACINALFELEKFVECRETCLSAYKDFPKKTEFARKAALCLSGLNQPEDAANELENLVRGRRVPWYMYADLSKLHFECGFTEKSWTNCCLAAQANGELKTKVNLFQLMARILLVKGNRDGASAHAYFAAQLRTEQGWGVPDDLSELLCSLNVQSEGHDTGSLLDICRKYWSNQIMSSDSGKDSKKRYNGILLLKNSQLPFAFIKSDDFEENVYVKMADVPDNLRHDSAQISFYIQSSFDTKKNRESFRAVEILSF